MGKEHTRKIGHTHSLTLRVCVNLHGFGLGVCPVDHFMIQQAKANHAKAADVNATMQCLICRNQLWSTPPGQFVCVCRVIVLSSDLVSSESATSTQPKPDRCVRLPFITFTNVIIAPAGQSEGELSE